MLRSIGLGDTGAVSEAEKVYTGVSMLLALGAGIFTWYASVRWFKLSNAREPQLKDVAGFTGLALRFVALWLLWQVATHLFRHWPS